MVSNKKSLVLDQISSVRTHLLVVMNVDNLLHRDKVSVRRAVLAKLGKNEETVEKVKKLLKEWFESQGTLPEMPEDNILELFLVVNKFNLDRCKKKLACYYQIRKEIPELYLNTNPKLKHMQLIANAVYIIPLPQLTSSLSRVTVLKLKDLNPDNFDALRFFAHSYNILEVRIREDIVLADTLIYDLEGFQFGHVTKLHLGAIRKAALVLEKVFSTRLEGIHYLNLPSSMQMLVNVVKTVLPEKMRKRIHVHKDLRSLQSHVTKDVLPGDYGGSCQSLENLHRLWLQKLQINQDLFDHLETFATSNVQKSKNMSKLAKLLQVTEEEKEAILKHYSLTEEKFEDTMKILKEWVRQSEHLPQEEDDNKLRLVLLNAKMSLEKAKQSVEGYYRVRSRYFNEFFGKLTPDAREYQEGKKLVKTVVVPRLTPDLCRVTIFKMSDPEGEAEDALMYEVPVFMMAEMRIIHDMCLSNIIIIDWDGYSWKNLVKFTPTINLKLVDVMNSINLRIQHIHFVNTINFLDHVMMLLKTFLPSKIINKIVIHKTPESLLDYVPKQCLPSNYGGSEKPLEELYDEWCEQIEESKELFDKLLQLKYAEKLELDPYQQDMFGCGVEGSFKQLALD